MQRSMPAVIGYDEAASNFPRLATRVESGEEIFIARSGHPTIRMSPVSESSTLEERRIAITGMRRIASEFRLDGERLRELIEAGRR